MSPDASTGQGSGKPVQPQTGVVTLLFTDIVSSTALKQHLGDKAGAVLIQEHHALVRQLLGSCPGAEEIETAGDSFLLSFLKPSDAVKFALVLQGRLRALNQGRGMALHDRIGIHLGEVVIEQHAAGHKPKDLYGIQIDTCSRVMSLAKGGQVLLSRGVFDSARQVLKGEDIEGVGQLEWLNHGPYLLKGLDEPVEICEVREAGQEQAPGPPTTSEKAQRKVSPDEEPVLGWRPAVGQLVPNTRWVLEKKLGEGGFGEVWLGRQQTTKEHRVFKFCFQAERVRFLKRELTLFRVLKERVGDHPNIVRLHDVFLDQAPFYVEMDYVEGSDLRSWCEAQGGVETVPLETRLEIVAQAADGLQAAHEAGIIHRDIKPANILIGGRGTGPAEVHVKLTDFGIGQVVSEDYLKGITRAGFTQTILGSSSTSHTGTQLYMAPELLAGKPASTRSDIYSLGVVLYQLLVGDFGRPVATDWADDITDPLLRDDLRHCFAGNAQDRFIGAGQLAKNLRALPDRRAALARQQAEMAARERAAYRRGMIRTAALATVVVALVSGLAVLAFRQSRIAKNEAGRAEKGEQKAKKSELAARHNLYLADMNAVQEALQENNLGRANLLLGRHFPKPGEEDLRGVEWRYLWNLCQGQETLTLDFNDYPVNAVTFSRDGRLLALASFDNKVTIIDVVSRKILKRLSGRFVSINSHTLAFSRDGKYLAAADRQAVNLWRTNDWQLEHRLEGDSVAGNVVAVVFSPDGKTVATACDGKLALWDLFTGKRQSSIDTKLPTTYLGHGHSLAYASDGKTIAIAGIDRIELWNVQPLAKLDFTGRLNAINSLGWSSNWLVAGSWDGDLKLWDSGTGREIVNFKAHPTFAFALAFSPDGKTLATGGGDQKIHLWDLASLSADSRAANASSEVTILKKRATLQGHLHEVWALDFSTDGQLLASGSKDGSAKLWSTAAGTEAILPGARVPIRFSSDGKSLLTLNTDQTLSYWDVLSRRITHLVNPALDTNQVTAWTISTDGNTLATATTNGTVEFLDLDKRTHTNTQVVAAGVRIFNLEFSSTDRLLLIAGSKSSNGEFRQTISVLNRATGQQQGPLDGAQRPFAFSPDERTLVTGGANYTIKVWDLATLHVLASLRKHTWVVTTAGFAPNGKLLMTASSDNTIRLWDAATWKETAVLRGHMGGLRPCVFSADGKTLISESADGVIKMWNVETRQELFSFKTTYKLPSNLLLSPDRSVLAMETYTRGQDVGDVFLLSAPSFAEIDAREKAKSAALIQVPTGD